MKKSIIVLAALAVVFVCSGVAIVVSNERQAQVKSTQSLEVTKLKNQLKENNTSLVSRDSALQQAAAQIDVLTQKNTALSQTKTTLCNQLRIAKLAQPLCTQ
jgi:peptidoglycan hydrolase CwlO-like protein